MRCPGVRGTPLNKAKEHWKTYVDLDPSHPCLPAGRLSLSPCLPAGRRRGEGRVRGFPLDFSSYLIRGGKDGFRNKCEEVLDA